MNTPKQSRQAGIVQAIAVGFIALVLLSIPLYWGRFFCEMALVEQIPSDVSGIVISPSGLVPPEIENDPNVTIHSQFDASMSTNRIDLLGIVDYLIPRMPRGPYSNVYFAKDFLLYFDENSGLFVYEYTGPQAATGSKTVSERVKLFAGPEGVSSTIDKTLGRFLEPIRRRSSIGYNQTLFITYDKKERRFFKMDFESRTVTKGPKVKDEKNYNPLQIEYLYNYYSTSLSWKPPLTEVKGVDANNYDERNERKGLQNINGRIYKPVIEQHYMGIPRKYLLVLDKSGRIDLLDKQSLEIAGTAGYLPAPQNSFSSKQTAVPKDLFDYQILPLSFPGNEQYRGMCAAAISREGRNMAVAVFDSNGTLLQNRNTEENFAKLRGKDACLAGPFSATLAIAKYLLENLHPPILSAASYLTADTFDAASGHRAMFLLPNSFVAMKGRQIDKIPQQKIAGAFLLMLPSIILSLFLARLVSRDAAVRGLSKKAKRWWVIVVVAFGLPAYISYRLTKPDVTLVTCQNCGLGRRPDMEACHRCGSKWFVPELVPPDWRVVN
jgi:hypothetical protein